MCIARTGGFPARTLVALIALLLLITPAPVRAADDKGSISGTVKDVADKPVAGLNLRLEQDTPIDGRRGKGKGGGAAGGTKVVARVTSDQQGNFTVPNLPPGTYRLVAGSKNVGWIYMDVVVEAGKETKLGDVKLAKTD